MKFLIGTLSALLLSQSSFVQAESPNVLLLITDEHNFRTIGAHRKHLSKEQAKMWGDTSVQTNNIDRIANEGVIFTSMYAASPVCTPSRASMFTGMYPQNTGAPKNDMVMNENLPTIANVLAKNGYETGYAGKWHLSGKAKPGWGPSYNYGFKDNRYMFNRGHWKLLDMKKNGDPFVPHLKDEKQRINVKTADKSTYTTDYLTDRALEFIDKNKEKPFFYTISYPDPHTPNSVRPPYNTMYNDMKVKMPRTYTPKPDSPTPSWFKALDNLTPELLNKHVPQYFGMVKLIDDNVGRLLAKLEKEGILDNTLVIFSADHGDHLGEHHRDNKGVITEGSGLIPFMMRYPTKIPSGTVVNAAANTTDWMDTIVSLVDAKSHNSDATEGRNLTPLLSAGGDKNWHDVTFSRMGSWAAAVTDRYKYVLTASKNTPVEPWLFDLQEDPDELKNFIHSTSHQGVVKHLNAELKRYLKESKDPLSENINIQKQIIKYM